MRRHPAPAALSLHKETKLTKSTAISQLGNRVEVKNLNSIRAIVSAAKYEFDRQVKITESGGKISQETRSFDKKKLISIPTRKKETSRDYRFL